MSPPICNLSSVSHARSKLNLDEVIAEEHSLGNHVRQSIPYFGATN
jgi:hypothetical protein